MRTLLSFVVLAAVAAVAVAACRGADGPSARAVDDYLARQAGGPGATAGDAVTVGDAGPGAAPIATRVALTVESGRGLPDTDSGPGETDPYVVLDYDGQRFETGVVEGSLDPVWGDSFVLDVRPGGVLTVSLMDEDALASDDKLGIVSLPLDPLRVGESKTLELAFRNGEGGHLTMTFVGLQKP